MATGKRYYWIKLKESFMHSDTVDYLMSLPDGANYVVLYQMLCLKTINTDGKLSRTIGEVIIPFDIEKIQRDCKWFSADTIRVAMNLYKSFGLIYEDVDGTLVMADHGNLVGSETDWAAQKRMKKGKNPELPVESSVEIFHTDIRDKEIKRLDIRDKEFRDREKEGKTATAYFLQHINPTPSPNVISTIESYIDDGMEEDCIIAILQYCQDNNKTSWGYIKVAIEGNFKEGVRTVEDYNRKREEKKKPKEVKKTSFNNFESRQEGYADLDDEYFESMKDDNNE